MFHQLHCLQNLREGLQLLGLLANGTLTEQEVLDKTDMVHLGHCVDYIRQVGFGEISWIIQMFAGLGLWWENNGKKYTNSGQSIICAADDTIEVPKMAVDSFDMISGHNVLHQCRDKEAVWRMSVESGYVDPDMPFEVPDSMA
jgi:hypothetical protein